MLLLDNSAWSRFVEGVVPDDRARTIAEWFRRRELAVCLPFTLEAGYSARSMADHKALMDRFDKLPRIAIDSEVERMALQAQRELAEIGHHRLAIVSATHPPLSLHRRAERRFFLTSRLFVGWRFLLDRFALLHPSTATVTVGFSRAPFCPVIAVNIVRGFFVHTLELAARIDVLPSGRIRSKRRIGTSGIVLNVTEVMFLTLTNSAPVKSILTPSPCNTKTKSGNAASSFAAADSPG